MLPNGPEMAAAFVAIGAGATTAPLNPAYRAEEFEFYLTDLNAKALVLDAAGNAGGRAGGGRLGVPILRLETDADAPAGEFTLVGRGDRRGRRRRARAGRTTSRWCCTPPAPRRGQRSCR